MKFFYQTSSPEPLHHSLFSFASLRLCAFALKLRLLVCGCSIILLLAVAVSGCTSKSTARAEARAAYFAGQAEAMQAQRTGMLPSRAPGNTVAIVGPVKFPALTWTPDLTLIKTIVAAEYIPEGDPRVIVITRDGQQIPVSAAILLNGQDIPLLPGDVVELRQ